MVRGSSKFGDNLRGAFRARARGEGTGYSAIRNGADEVRLEREARQRKSAAKRLEKQALAWEQKFRDGRNLEIKATYNVDQGYTDMYFGGTGGKPDGPGHGHIRVWEDGREQVVREPYRPHEPHGRQDATLLDDRTEDKRS